MGLYQKHRPSELSLLLGNGAIKSSLTKVKADFDAKKPHSHAFLFIGGSGCGKTTLARIIKNMFACSDKDYYEMNAANTRGIDTIREIDSNAKLAPMNGKVKVYLIDECHQITGTASEALLKLLEDPPRHCYFVLCTTNPEKLLGTIKTRCATYQVEALKKRDILTLCKRVMSEEEADVSISVLTEIAKVCDGSPRKALVLLEAVIGMSSEEEQIKVVNAAMADEATIKDLIDALTRGAKWGEISKILKAIDGDAEGTRRQILGYMNAILLNNGDPKIAILMSNFAENYYDSGKAGLTMSCFMAVNG